MCPEPVEGPAGASAQDEVLARLVRREAGLIVAQLHRRLGDFDVAEEAVQEAITVALRTWRRDGVPPNPGGWLATTARRRAIDLLRRRTRESRLADELADDPTVGVAANRPGDERLPMLFGCCHPALGVEARLALTLRAVVGMPTGQIARAFLVPEATMAQRLVRAKRKITDGGDPVHHPGARPAGAAARRRAHGDLPDLQRRLPGSVGGGPGVDRGCGLAGRAGGRGDAGPAGGLGPAGPADLLVRAYAGAVRRRRVGWCGWRSRTGLAGTRWRSPGRTGTWSRRRRCDGRGGTSCRRRWPGSTPARRPGPRPTGCRSRCCTTCWLSWTARRSSG